MHNYEDLHGSSYAVFHGKNIKQNAWKAVSGELGIEDGAFLLNQSNFWFSRVESLKQWGLTRKKKNVKKQKKAFRKVSDCCIQIQNIN